MPNELNHPYHIPQVTVQPDWVEVVADVLSGAIFSESFWISCYRKGSPSVHGSVKVTKVPDEPNLEFSGNDGVEVTKISNHSFYLTCDTLEISEIIVKGPRSTFKRIHSSEISSMDISPGGGLFVTGDTRGLLKVGDTKDGIVRRELEGHVGDINTCRFFPSGQVILSGAGDFQLRIWSALDGSNPVTLKGHTKGVTDTAIISRGRNILSSSRDGTIRLWDCGSSSVLNIMGHYSSSIHKLATGKFTNELTYDRNSSFRLDSREVETQDKIVLAALDNGSLIGLDLRSKSEIFSTSSYRNVSLYSCAYSPNHNLVVAGSIQGVIEVFDARNINQTIFAIQRNEASVNDLVFVGLGPNLLVAQGDGAIFQFSTASGLEIAQATYEYTGFDLDPVRSIRALDNGDQIYAAGRDGCLRKY
ncbi:hypothetical protein G9A89_017492 [Geosiphon pyriformis]|nr:hypothetical protein G9A89_017492 [Geosiphon pyriformis]